MSEPFHGVLSALITPFSDDGSTIDTDALTAIVGRLVGAGVTGLVPGGSTGEFTTLSHAERRELVETTVEAAGGRVPVVAGTGALSTRETVELSVHAEQAGAAAVMIVPPFYEALSWRELLAHYTAVAGAIEMGNSPSRALRTPAGTAWLPPSSSKPTRRPSSTAGTRSPSPRSPPACEPSSGVWPRYCPSSASSCTVC